MLGYPISANRYWRNFGGRMVLSAEATRFKRESACKYAMSGGKYHHVGLVAVSLILHPKLTKSGDASKTRIDIDNCIKVSIDALNTVAYADDKQVVRLTAEIGYPVNGGGLSVMVTPC
jgi:crossover junction endodeoxyribonuclease RusA